MRNIKEHLHRQKGFPHLEQRLVFKGNQLKDDCNLEDVGLRNDDHVMLLVPVSSPPNLKRFIQNVMPNALLLLTQAVSAHLFVFNCCNAQLVKQESALPFEAPFLLGQPAMQVCVFLLTYSV